MSYLTVIIHGTSASPVHGDDPPIVILNCGSHQLPDFLDIMWNM
jgi:hypothetical protein